MIVVLSIFFNIYISFLVISRKSEVSPCNHNLSIVIVVGIVIVTSLLSLWAAPLTKVWKIRLLNFVS